jgi:hypothetical protein
MENPPATHLKTPPGTHLKNKSGTQSTIFFQSQSRSSVTLKISLYHDVFFGLAWWKTSHEVNKCYITLSKNVDLD